MPKFNGTGPMGYGPGTGRGMGFCEGGMGYGCRNSGCSQRLGWRKFFGNYPDSASSKKEETEMLSEEAGLLEEELKTIKSRLAQLKGQK